MINQSQFAKWIGIAALALGAASAYAGNACQAQWSDVLATESYADAVCSAGAEGCDNARAQAEASFRDYAECMAYETQGPF